MKWTILTKYLAVRDTVNKDTSGKISRLKNKNTKINNKLSPKSQSSAEIHYVLSSNNSLVSPTADRPTNHFLI